MLLLLSKSHMECYALRQVERVQFSRRVIAELQSCREDFSSISLNEKKVTNHFKVDA